MVKGYSISVLASASVLSLLPGSPVLDAIADISIQTAEERGVTSTIEAIFAAAQSSDFVALDSLYAGDDLTIIEGAGIDRGWANYRDHHLRPELEHFRSFEYRPYDIEAHIAGETAWAIFRYDLKIELEDRSIDNVGRGTAILENRNGRWVVRHMQTASRARG